MALRDLEIRHEGKMPIEEDAVGSRMLAQFAKLSGASLGFWWWDVKGAVFGSVLGRYLVTLLVNRIWTLPDPHELGLHRQMWNSRGSVRMLGTIRHRAIAATKPAAVPPSRNVADRDRVEGAEWHAGIDSCGP